MEVRMLYRKYKQSYSDCATVPGSYDRVAKSIVVDIPEGRMKPSVSRGRKYSFFPGVMVKDKDGNIWNIGGIKALDWSYAVKQIRRLGYEPISPV